MPKERLLEKSYKYNSNIFALNKNKCLPSVVITTTGSK